MKKIFCAVIALFLVAGAFSKGGVMSGAGKLSVIRTQYFDIIYPLEATDGAEKIAAVADGYYEEISALLHAPCNEHFPVTITHSVENLNAYFTAVPYNAIVLYDTPPEPSLDQHSESITAVFYHELTHAVTTNIRSPVAGFLAGLLGDWIAPAGFLQTSFMLEGAAVSFESLAGEGRVHDPYNTQLVQQAKRDGRFPDWRDVTGARDTFPGGTDAYAFGALFCWFLQENYGMDAYAQFWKTTGNGHGFKHSIKKAYGKPIAYLWKAFEAWVPVPPATDAIASGTGTDDFFVAQSLASAKKTGFSRQNSRRSVFKCIDTSAYGVVWYDSKTGGVWYAPVTNGTAAQAKKLCTCGAVSRLALSPDGEWLALSYLYADANTKAAVALYHLPSKTLVPLSLASVRDAGFVRESDGSLLLACVNIAHDTLSLAMYTVGTRKKDVSLVRSVSFAQNEIPFNPCAAEDGGFACIVKNGLDWKIRLYHADGSYRAYGGEKTILHNLHCFASADGRLAFSFSYAQMGASARMFSRAGVLYVSLPAYASELVLQNDDVSGSVLDAALLSTDRGEQLVYTAAFYDTHRLMQMDFSRRKLIRHTGNAPEAVGARGATTFERDETAPHATDFSSAAYETTAYNPFRYYRHGMLIPVGMVSCYKRDALDEYTFGYTEIGSAFVGATYGSANPWLDKIFVLSGGWDPFDKNGGVYLDYSGGTDTFTYDVNGNVLFDGYGFMQATEGVSLAKTMYARFGTSLTAGANGTYFYGHAAHGEKNDWAGRGQGYVRFSTVRKMSPRYADYGGVTFQPFVLWERVWQQYVNAGASVGARIPGLFPLSLSATLFPSSSYAASAGASVVLWSWEVQKGIPIALYVDRIYLFAAYAGKIAYRCDTYFDIQRTADIFQHVTKDDYSDVVQVRLSAISSINAGVLTRMGFDTGIVFQYRPHAAQNKKKMDVGVSATLVY